MFFRLNGLGYSLLKKHAKGARKLLIFKVAGLVRLKLYLAQTTDISTLLISDNINFPVTQKPRNHT